MWCWWPVAAPWACARACASERRETNTRSVSAMSTIITIPPTYSASANCQPISTQRTSPSSHTRLVEANWKESAVAAEAPLANSDLPIAIAAYEHDEEAAPRPVARATAPGPAPDSADSMRSRGTQACTIAEMANPSTRAHHTSQAMRKASFRAEPMTSRMAAMRDRHDTLGGYGDKGIHAGQGRAPRP